MQYERLIARPNPVNRHYCNDLFTRYEFPLLTWEYMLPLWMEK